MAADLDHIDLGWGLDRKAANTYLDLSVTAKPGTRTADEMAMAALAKTAFAGFRASDAAMTWALASVIPQVKQEIALSLIDALRGKFNSEMEKEPAGKHEAAKKKFNDFAELLTKIVKSGRVNAVMTGLLSENSATGIGAIYVADGKLFNKIVHEIAPTKDERPDLMQYVTLDAGTLSGMPIHKISFPIPENAENRDAVVKYIGETLNIVVAVGKENVYFAAGRHAEARLKKAVEASQSKGLTAVSPLVVSYAGRPIAGAIAAAGKPDQRPAAKIAAAELKKTPGKDHVSLTLRPIDNGVRLRLQVEQGLLRLPVMAAQGKLAAAAPSSEN